MTNAPSHSTITLVQLCNAVADALGKAEDIALATSYDGIADAVQQNNTLQVWPNTWNVDPLGETDRQTFGGGLRVMETTISANVYIGIIGGDRLQTLYARATRLADQMNAILEEQKRTLFGLNGIKYVRWTGTIGDAEYARQTWLTVHYDIVLGVF